MPNYNYECSGCGYTFQEFQGMSEKSLEVCPKCKKKKLVRLISGGSGVIFKGTGFYETDYKKKPITESKTDSTSKKDSSTETSKESPKEASKDNSQKSSKESTVDSSAKKEST